MLSMDSTTATGELEAAGLVVVLKQKGGTGQPPGTVVKMVPDAGTVVATRLDRAPRDRQVDALTCTGGRGRTAPPPAYLAKRNTYTR